MRNKRMEKLLSKVQKSRVANYTRTYQSSYVDMTELGQDKQYLDLL